MKILTVLFGMILHTTLLISDEVMVKTSLGERIVFEVAPETPFAQVISDIAQQTQQQYQTAEMVVLDFYAGANGPTLMAVKATNSKGREYFQQVTKQQKEDFNYIVTTLASDSWASLLFSKSSLKAAGDRLDVIHPLRFVHTLFADEDLKNAVHVIRKRSLKKIWKEFFAGIADSFQREAAVDNITKEQIQDFAKSLKIPVNGIQSSLLNQDWSGFMEGLLEALPRTGDTTRYDM